MSSTINQTAPTLPTKVPRIRALPRQLKDFRGYHAGETILVCGCGTSLSQVVSPDRFVTIGVNDVGRLFHPDYLVVLNPRQQFKADRFRYVEESRARAIFTQLDLGIQHPHIVKIRLGKFGGVDLSDTTVLHFTRNSPYLAVCLAVHMGAKRVGLIGVDFTEHHFFAATGRHPLAGELAQIDREYKALYDSCALYGVELVNLSHQSRLTALPRSTPERFVRNSAIPESSGSLGGKRIFFVNYKFLSCGDVFRDGLSHAADDLKLVHEEAYWDDPGLASKVKQFSPDLLFVVHGRRFFQRWKYTFKRFRSAVWLLDEPYEVDDTARFSGLFDTVLVNDPVTLHRHRNAQYLPAGYDPVRHLYRPGVTRKYAVGFIGGYNRLREQMLGALAERGLLSYVVGGPWRRPSVRALNLSTNIPAEQTAELYRDTRIVLNVFRTEHHFNRQQLPATSFNPRVYEGIACGALVVSEDRPEAGEICPSLPVFSSADELVHVVEELVHDADRYDLLRKACIRQLARQTYAQRLHAALALIFEKERPINSIKVPELSIPRSADATTKTLRPTYNILMVVHNALAMTQLSTLKTLQHSSQDARLIVVDNASNDGAGRWLKILAQRGDVQLIVNSINRGHGPALEQARRAGNSPYIVTLDSDAFPLSGDWLPQLRRRLSIQVKVAGIRHYRDYIHPSCLMIERMTLDGLDLSFLDEKGRSSQFDVAERISHEIKRRGFLISGLEQVSSLRRGSISEPVDLGAEYSGIVYHQWYTTRSFMAGDARVDDVPNERIERSLREVFEKYHAEPRELAVIVGVRAESGEARRLRNAIACLQALNLQDLERWRYRIIVVEQDSEPRLESHLAPFADRYLFAYNPGPYNRGWGFNIGASAAAATKALCLMDADLLVPPSYLSGGLKAFEAGRRALRPFSEIVYLDAASTEQAIEQRLAAPMGAFPVEGYRGQIFRDSNGGCLWVEPRLYKEIGGHDERFRGWGWEDRELWRRLAGLAKIESRPGRLLHLDHPRPNMNDRWAMANSKLGAQLAKGEIQGWTGPIGDPLRYAEEKQRGAPALSVSRDWENWHRWAQERIALICTSEAGKPIHASARWRLAQILLSLGQTLLDVGCGPGALWIHLQPYRERISWAGVDITHRMLEAALRCFPQVPVTCGDSGSLPFKDDAFDTVLLRHVLEHQPPWLMERSLAQATRVARRAVVLDFYVPPSSDCARRTRRAGESFLETRWTTADIETPIAKAGWYVHARLSLACSSDDQDEVWILRPRQSQTIATSEGPKVSIIMPTYRRCHTLVRALQTICAQTYSNWELILVDNSGDGGYWFADSRIRVFRHSETTSASYARNRGLGHATGDLVCFFDDDDEMFPTYVERFVSAFRANPGARMVRCGMLIPGGRTDYSFATPESCLCRNDAIPIWTNRNYLQDQHYFSEIVRRNHWTVEKGDIIVLREALCRSHGDPYGGLRAGRL